MRLTALLLVPPLARVTAPEAVETTRASAAWVPRRWLWVVAASAVGIWVAIAPGFTPARSSHPSVVGPVNRRLIQTQSVPASAQAGAGLARLESLPLHSQAEISMALGADQTVFSPTRLGTGFRLTGGGLRAQLRGPKVVFSSGEEALSMSLAGVGHRGGMGHPTSGSLRAGRHRVVYETSGTTAWYAAGPLGIEQGFTVAKRPTAGTGDLAIALRLGGSLRARLVGGTLDMLTRSGAVAIRYGGLRAVDATGRRLGTTFALRGRTLFLEVADADARYPVRIDPFVQQGNKLDDPTGSSGQPNFGDAVALSANGTTLLVGGEDNDSGVGAAWVFTKSGGTWTQQAELTGSGETGAGYFGDAVALSADGNTALVGGEEDNGELGAAWFFTRSGSTWSQQGSKVTGVQEDGEGNFGNAVALSGEGNSALIGGEADTSAGGAVWAYTLSGTTWKEEQKLTRTGSDDFGGSVAMSADGSTALIGDGNVDSLNGRAWIYVDANPPAGWTEQAELLPSDASGDALFGYATALSADGDTALIGGYLDDSGDGAAWVFTRSGTAWSQQGPKLTPTGEAADGRFGSAVALSSDGNTALISATSDSNQAGAVWMFGRSGTAWVQEGSKLTPSGESNGSEGGLFGSSIAFSSDAATAVIGGQDDDDYEGAVWQFTDAPVAQTLAATGVSAGTVTVNGTLAAGTGGSVSFEYGTSTSYGSQSATQTIASSGGSTPVTATLTGLAPSTTYHYQLVATNSAGASDGGDQTFTTPAAQSTGAGTTTGGGGTTSTGSGTTTGGGGTTSTTTPGLAAPSVRTVTVGDQRLKLTTPSPQVCAAAGAKLTVALSAKTLSKGTKLTFLNARVYIGKGVAHRERVRVHGKVKTVPVYVANATITRLPASPQLSVAGVKAGSQTLKVVVTFSERVSQRGRHRILKLTKTLTTAFTVC